MQTTDKKPPLWDALSVILPTAQETLFLRACLSSGETAAKAWKQWQFETGGLIGVLHKNGNPIKGLLPLLYDSLRRNQVILEPAVVPILNYAYLREKSRYERYLRILAQVLGALKDGGIPTIILEGATLGETVYPEPSLRHSHNIELLVEPHNLTRAASLVLARGFSAESSGENQAIEYTPLHHSSGLPLRLLNRLFDTPYYEPPNDLLAQAMWSGPQRPWFDGIEGRILTPELSLMRVLGQAFSSASRHSLIWVCDAWYLIENTPGLDWDFFIKLATRSNLALPLAKMFSYLAEKLNAAIPSSVIGHLKSVSMRTGALGYELALRGAHQAPNGRIKNLMNRAQRWDERIILVKWLVFPSPRYLKMTQGVERTRRLPLLYLMRPLRYLTHRF